MQVVPLGSFGNQINPLLAQNQAMGVPLGNVQTLAPQQGRLVDLGKSPAMIDAQFNQQIYRDDRLNQNALELEKNSNQNALNRLSVENDFRMDQIKEGNANALTQQDRGFDHAETMAGITREHQQSMEGLRQSNNLAVQAGTQTFESNMAKITREFQAARQELAFKKDNELYERGMREEKQKYKNRRREALQDFRNKLEQQGAFNEVERFWDSLADERKIDFQINAEEASFKRKQGIMESQADRARTNAISDASGTARLAEQAYREYSDWHNQGGKFAWMAREKENLERAYPFKDPSAPTPEEKRAIDRALLSNFKEEESRRNQNHKQYGEMKIPGGFDPNALAPGSTIKNPLNPQQLRAIVQRLQQLRAQP